MSEIITKSPIELQAQVAAFAEERVEDYTDAGHLVANIGSIVTGGAVDIERTLKRAEYREEFSFGNINNNDWYMFSGITLTYTFGTNPCYCPE